MSRNWARLRKEVPVHGLPDRFFRKAKWTDLKLSKISLKDADTEIDLLEINEDVTSVVQQFRRSIESVYRQAKDYDEAAKKVYKLVDINLRFYRYTEIDEHVEDLNPRKSSQSKIQLQKFKSGMESMMETLYGSIQRANQDFKPKESVDDNLLYLLNLAKQFETSIKYFGRYSRDQDDKAEWQFIEDFDNEEDDEDEIINSLEDMDNEDDNWAAKAEEQMEQELQEVG